MKKILLILSTFMMFSVFANSATQQLFDTYKKQGITSFSEARGQQLWVSDHNGRSCTSCHTNSVKNTGKHKRTGKAIQAMAPSVNLKRLTSVKKIKKWFLRNCKWTLKRECTAQEQGDILAWLIQQ